MDQFASDIILNEGIEEKQVIDDNNLSNPLTEDSSEYEAWWKSQFWTLFLGLACGVGVNMLSRLWTFGRYPAMNNSASRTATISNMSTDNKMVLVVRTDLNMGKGKVAAQCAHAAVACYKKAVKKTPMLLKQWEVFGQAKVTLKAPAFQSLSNSDSSSTGDQGASLETLSSQAQGLGIVSCIIHDAGRTQIERGASTVLGIGPAPSSTIDLVTGNLKLY